MNKLENKTKVVIDVQKKKFIFLEFVITAQKANKITGSQHFLAVLKSSDSFFRMS